MLHEIDWHKLRKWGGDREWGSYCRCGSNVREILGIYIYRVGEDPSDSKSNWLHVDIFRFYFHSFEIYSVDSSKLMGKFPEVLNLNRLFLELNQFICN